MTDFRTLFHENYAYVWSVLRRLGIREADAEDCAHEVFLAVHRRLAEYDSQRPLRPWLFAFAYRIAADHRRRTRLRREVMVAESDTADPSTNAEAQLATSEERSLLLQALDELDIDRRAVIVLHDWDGEPIPEVARALGIPLNTAYSRLRLARQDLERAVKRWMRQRRRA